MKCINCLKNSVSDVNKEYCFPCQKKLDNLTEAELQKLYTEKHANQDYGKSSEALVSFLQPFVDDLEPERILDFGCGQSNLINMLDLPEARLKKRYDFAIPKYSTLPEGSFDLVICTDVLEHVPKTNLDNFLKIVKSKSENVIFQISCVPAKQNLANNTEDQINAHCTLKTPEEWMEFLQGYFSEVEDIRIEETPSFLIVKTWK